MLRDECRWPTTHQFALTDTQGQALHGCCLTVWEPLASQLVMTVGNVAESEAEASKRGAGPGAAGVEGVSGGGGGGGGGRGGEEEEEAAAEASVCCAFAPGRSVYLSPDGGADGGADATSGGASMNGRPMNCAVRALHAATLYAPKCLCVLSPHPFHASLRRWLCGLYRHSLSEGDLPLEAYVGLLLWECPVPPPGHLTVHLSLAADVIPFALPAPSQQLPLCQVRLRLRVRQEAQLAP